MKMKKKKKEKKSRRQQKQAGGWLAPAGPDIYPPPPFGSVRLRTCTLPLFYIIEADVVRPLTTTNEKKKKNVKRKKEEKS